MLCLAIGAHEFPTPKASTGTDLPLASSQTGRPAWVRLTPCSFVRSDLRAEPQWRHGGEWKRSSGWVEGHTVAADCSGQIVVRGAEVAGSVLHALDTANFFHFIREGVVPLLLLWTVRELDRLLLPDTARWHAWAEALKQVVSRGQSCG